MGEHISSVQVHPQHNTIVLVQQNGVVQLKKLWPYEHLCVLNDPTNWAEEFFANLKPFPRHLPGMFLEVKAEEI